MPVGNPVIPGSGSGQPLGSAKGGIIGGLIVPAGTIQGLIKSGGRPFRFTYRKLLLTRNL